MTKRDMLVGLAASVVLHTIFFAPWRPRSQRIEDADRKTAAIRVLAPELTELPRPEQPAPRVQPMAERQEAPAPTHLAGVARGGGDAKQAGDTTLSRPEPARSPGAADRNDQPTPPLRMDVTDPDTVLAASQSLGVRLVAIDGAGQVRALVTVDRDGLPEARPMPDTAGYSNRIRMLPQSGYFGGVLGQFRKSHPELPASTRLALLVPADLDSRWLAEQRALLAQAGNDANRYMTVGRYEMAGGGYALKIELVER